MKNTIRKIKSSLDGLNSKMGRIEEFINLKEMIEITQYNNKEKTDQGKTMNRASRIRGTITKVLNCSTGKKGERGCY